MAKIKPKTPVKIIKPKRNPFDPIIKGFTAKIVSGTIADYMAGGKFVLKFSPFSDEEPIKPTKKDIEALSGQVFDNIKGVTDIMSKDINNTVRKGILERKDTKQIAKDLDGVFKGDNPTGINYQSRLKAVARTESARTFNAGGFANAKKFGAKKKYLVGVSDAKQGDDSKVALSKYGTEEKAIPINENFEFTYNGKLFSYLYPPGRTNDRETIKYVWEE